MTSRLSELVIYILVAACAMPAAAEEIVLRREALPKGAVVRLGDVAEIRGEGGDRAAQLARLPLMPAPVPGSTRFVRTREIEDMLVAQGEDMRQIRFAGAQQVAVQSPIAAPLAADASSAAGETKPVRRETSQPLDERTAREAALLQGRVSGDEAAAGDRGTNTQHSELVRQAIEKYLVERTGCSTGWQITCRLSERQSAVVAAVKSPLTCGSGSPPWTGRQLFEIGLSSAGQPLKLTVTADVALAQPVVVASRPIARGAIITGADVVAQVMDKPVLATGRRAPIFNVEELIGMEAKAAIQEGEVVFNDQVRAPFLVKRGDAVTVVAQGGGIRVRTLARATQDGALGDLVQVESIQTKEKYDARVTGFREAAVLVPMQAAEVSPEPPTRSESIAFRRYQLSAANGRAGVTRKANTFRALPKSSESTHVENR
jgi:flagella basal body P-ring formation protein FlgA